MTNFTKTLVKKIIEDIDSLTICDELVKQKLMTKRDYVIERKYCKNHVHLALKVFYKLVIWPLVLVMKISPRFTRLVSRVSRKLFINKAISK